MAKKAVPIRRGGKTSKVPTRRVVSAPKSGQTAVPAGRSGQIVRKGGKVQ